MSSPASPPSRLYINLYKQLKYLTLGSACLYVTRTDLTLRDLYLVHSSLTWPARVTLFLSLTCLAASIALFAAVMILGGRGAVQQGKVGARDHTVETSAHAFAQPDSWQTNNTLRAIVPLLSSTLVAGFPALVLALSPLCAPPAPSPLDLTRVPLWTTPRSWSIATPRHATCTPLSCSPTHTSTAWAWLVAFAGAAGVYQVVLGAVGLVGVVTGAPVSVGGRREEGAEDDRKRR